MTTSYVSRGGLKLRHALDTFHIDPTNLVCADLGCSTGGFTDCLLQSGAAKVYDVDTAYGQLAWKLRKDPRVVVMERQNALHATPPEPVDLVVADLGWTPQRLLIPVALKWLKPAASSPQHLDTSTPWHPPLLITLIKPHYELKATGKELPRGGVLDEADARSTTDAVVASLPALGVHVLAITKSPITGGATEGKRSKGTGNTEWLALVAPAGSKELPAGASGRF